MRARALLRVCPLIMRVLIWSFWRLLDAARAVRLLEGRVYGVKERARRANMTEAERREEDEFTQAGGIPF